MNLWPTKALTPQPPKCWTLHPLKVRHYHANYFTSAKEKVWLWPVEIGWRMSTNVHRNELSRIIELILHNIPTPGEQVIIGERGHMEAWRCCCPVRMVHGPRPDGSWQRVWSFPRWQRTPFTISYALKGLPLCTGHQEKAGATYSTHWEIGPSGLWQCVVHHNHGRVENRID